MKIETDQSKIIIYLSFFDKNEEFDCSEENFKELFLKLKKYYKLDLKGYYKINVYQDKKYGIVLDIVKEDIEYIDYFNSQVEMKIIFYEEDFLYLLNNVYDIDILKKGKIYQKKDIYFKIINSLSKKEMLQLLENSKLIYNPEEIARITKL